MRWSCTARSSSPPRLSRRVLGGFAAGSLAALGSGGETGAQPRTKRKKRRQRRPGSRPPQPSFRCVTEWGRTGSGNSEYNDPRGIATDSQDNVYVSETEEYRIKQFAPN